MITIVVSAIATLVAAVIGSLLTYRYATEKYRRARCLTVASLNVLCKYKHYDESISEFNAAFSKAEKSVIIICLYHLGIPIVLPLDGQLDLQSIVFGKEEIDKKELCRMRKLVESGMCDEMFYRDYKTFFSADVKISHLRSLAKRFVEEALTFSSVANGVRSIPGYYMNRFTIGENRALHAFSKAVNVTDYYKQDGTFDARHGKDIASEIDAGLWDAYLLMPAEAYINMDTQYSVMMGMLRNIPDCTRNASLQHSTEKTAGNE